MMDKNGFNIRSSNLDNSINKFTSESRKCFQYSNLKDEHNLISDRTDKEDNLFKSQNMNTQNMIVSDNYDKKVKPGGILKKNKSSTKIKSPTKSQSRLKDTFSSRNTNSIDTLNFNDTKNLSVEYTIESLSPIRGNSLANDNKDNLN